MPNSKQIVYLSQAQYAELITNGTITVNGVTVTYNENDIYVTPQAEPVTDVRVNGTSIAANGVANIPVATSSLLGTVKVPALNGLTLDANGNIGLSRALIKNDQIGNSATMALTPSSKATVTFYGLAQAAGDNSLVYATPVGEYTDSAKAAIQQMLGISNLLAPTETTTASKAYSIGEVFTSNGKLYKATAAIAAADAIVVQNEGETVSGHNAEETNLSDGFVKKTDYATANDYGLVKTGGTAIGINANGQLYVNTNSSYGVRSYSGTLALTEASAAEVKTGTTTWKPVTPGYQHAAAFYGLAKAAGDSTQAASANAVGTYTDEAKTAIKSMIGVSDPTVTDVQVNGTSIVSSGVANIPIADYNNAGVVKISSTFGISIGSSGENAPYIRTYPSTDANIKAGNDYYRPITSDRQHKSVFYGLTKAAGVDMASSSNAVGTYTAEAKTAIKSMLGIVDGSTGTVDITGTTPTITAVENTRYVCGEVSTLSFTPAASGTCIVRFTSGSTATVLTLPSTVKFPEWFDATALEADTIYELCVTDGIYGAVMSWAL